MAGHARYRGRVEKVDGVYDEASQSVRLVPKMKFQIEPGRRHGEWLGRQNQSAKLECFDGCILERESNLK